MLKLQKVFLLLFIIMNAVNLNSQRENNERNINIANKREKNFHDIKDISQLDLLKNNKGILVLKDSFTRLMERIIKQPTGKDLFFVFLFFVGMILVILTPLILVTVFGHKARMLCLYSKNKNLNYANMTLSFLVLAWLGGFIPFIGPFLHLIGIIGTIVLIVLSNRHCH